MKKKIKQLVQFTGEYENKEQLILRDHLAMERTRLANERTLLSYIRTSLYLLLGGVGLLSLKNFEELRLPGYLSLVFSALFMLIGLLRFVQLKRQLKKFYNTKQ